MTPSVSARIFSASRTVTLSSPARAIGIFSSSSAWKQTRAGDALPTPGSRRWRSNGDASGSRSIATLRAFPDYGGGNPKWRSIPASPPAPAPQHQLHEPQPVEQCRDRAGARDGERRRLRRPHQRDVKLEADAEPERDRGGDHEAAPEGVEPLGVLAAEGDAVDRRRGHQQDHREGDERERGDVYRVRARRAHVTLEHDIEGDAETRRKRNERERREPVGRAVHALRVLAALDQPVLHRRRNQQPDRGCHEKIAARVEAPADRRDLLEGVLEHAVELKAEKNLAAEDQEARF